MYEIFLSGAQPYMVKCTPIVSATMKSEESTSNFVVWKSNRRCDFLVIAI